MKQKKAESKNAILWIIAAVVVVYVISSGVLNQAPAVTPTNNGPTSCSQNPSISTSFADSAKPGTAVTVSGQYKDVASGTYLGYSASNLQLNQVVSVITNATGYLTALQPQYTVKCGNQILTGNMQKFGIGTLVIYNDARTAALTNSTVGGATNESTTTSVKNWEVDFTGNPFTTTGKNLVIVELGTTLNVSAVSLSSNGNALTAQPCPSGYTAQITSGFCRAFEVPEVTTGSKVIYNLQATSLNGNLIQGAVYTTWLPEQAFVDSLSGAFVSSGAYDSNNAAVYYTAGKQVYNFLMK